MAVVMTTLGPKLQQLMDADAAANRPQDQQLRIGLYSLAKEMPVTNPAAPNE